MIRALDNLPILTLARLLGVATGAAAVTGVVAVAVRLS